MPDLSHKASQQYWSEYEDPMIYRVVTFMESVENNTMDGEEVLEAAIERLGSTLEDMEDVDMTEVGEEDAFIRLACNLKASRCLRILQAIDSITPGAASRVLVHAEETSENSDDPAGIFLRRNIVFERLRLMARVFSQQRFELIIHALEGEEE